MDKIYECAKAFEQLLKTQYHIIIGRKGKSVDLRIGFASVDFHHLAGIHKLKDLRMARSNREQVFNDIILRKITLSDLQKSQYYSEIEKRIEACSQLESILDNNRIMFKYNAKQQKFSLIQAEYLLTTEFDNVETYAFIDKRENFDVFFCCSIFPKEITDYTVGHAQYTMLFKEKINLATYVADIQYDRLTKK